MSTEVKKTCQKRQQPAAVQPPVKPKDPAKPESNWDKLHWHIERGGVTIH